MKKNFKIISLVICLSIVFSVVACSGNHPEGVKGTLSIASFEGGYGATWGQALADAYRKHNPGVEVKVDCNPLVRDDAVTALQTNITDVDIYFIDGVNVGGFCENYNSLADISELYTSTPKAGEKEENVLVKDKLRPEVVSEMMYGGEQPEYAGKYYTAPSPSGPCSLIMNETVLNNVLGEGNWSVPRTTDELVALCDLINSKNAKVNVAGVNYKVYPFIYSGGAVEYWRYLYYPWIAQYDGADQWDAFVTVKKDGVYDQTAYQSEGKLKAFKMLEKLIKRTNNYCDSSSMNNKFSQSQKYFFQGRACMYMTGDWLEREMEGATEYKADLRMVKTPVISDLSEKIEKDYSFSLGSTKEEKDEKLCEIISAVDNKQTEVSGVPAEVFNAVKDARAITFTLANNAIGVVPSVSVNKDLAIDFLRFMYSDEGLEIVLKESGSYIPVRNVEGINAGENITDFRKSVNEIINQEIVYIYVSSKDPIRYRAGLDYYVGNEKPEVALGKKTGYMSAYDYLQREATLLSSKWEEIMKVL